MPKAVELLRQGRSEELWQMCCGFLSLNLGRIHGYTETAVAGAIRVIEQVSPGQEDYARGRAEDLEEFRRQVPLTTYKDYCPELLEKREDVLPAKPAFWVHTSGRSGEYPCKWVPITPAYSHEMSVVSYGIGMLSTCQGWGDTSQIPRASQDCLCRSPQALYVRCSGQHAGAAKSVKLFAAAGRSGKPVF